MKFSYSHSYLSMYLSCSLTSFAATHTHIHPDIKLTLLKSKHIKIGYLTWPAGSIIHVHYLPTDHHHTFTHDTPIGLETPTHQPCTPALVRYAPSAICYHLPIPPPRLDQRLQLFLHLSHSVVVSSSSRHVMSLSLPLPVMFS